MVANKLLRLLFVSNTDDMVISPSYIPSRLRPCEFCYSEDELRKFLDIPDGSKYADDYGHSIMCVYFLIERKSEADITKAILQLEATLKIIKQKGHKLKEVMIVCNGLNETSSRIYNVRTQKGGSANYKQKVLYDKLKNIPVYCGKDKNYPIMIEYYKK